MFRRGHASTHEVHWSFPKASSRNVTIQSCSGTTRTPVVPLSDNRKCVQMYLNQRTMIFWTGYAAVISPVCTPRWLVDETCQRLRERRRLGVKCMRWSTCSRRIASLRPRVSRRQESVLNVKERHIEIWRSDGHEEFLCMLVLALSYTQESRARKWMTMLWFDPYVGLPLTVCESRHQLVTRGN